MNDAKQKKLYAVIGWELAHGMLDDEDGVRDALLDVAPEFVPPDGTDADDLYDDWQAMILDATGER